MNKCWILFYLSIFFVFPVFTAQSQTIAQVTFPAINNTVPTQVCEDLHPSTSVIDFVLSLHEIPGKQSTEISFQEEVRYYPLIWANVKKGGPANQQSILDLAKKTGALSAHQITVNKKINSNP